MIVMHNSVNNDHDNNKNNSNNNNNNNNNNTVTIIITIMIECPMCPNLGCLGRLDSVLHIYPVWLQFRQSSWDSGKEKPQYMHGRFASSTSR